VRREAERIEPRRNARREAAAGERSGSDCEVVAEALVKEAEEGCPLAWPFACGGCPFAWSV